MNLGKAPATYSDRDQNDIRATIVREDKRNQKTDADIELGDADGKKLFIRSPDGSRWYLTASDLGVLTLTAA